MIILVVSPKEGVCKSTTALHVACGLKDYGSVLVVDGDRNRTILNWEKLGKIPITVVDEQDTPGKLKQFEYIVIDTPANPEPEDINLLAARVDLAIIPVVPSELV